MWHFRRYVEDVRTAWSCDQRHAISWHEDWGFVFRVNGPFIIIGVRDVWRQVWTDRPQLPLVVSRIDACVGPPSKGEQVVCIFVCAHIRGMFPAGLTPPFRSLDNSVVAQFDAIIS